MMLYRVDEGGPAALSLCCLHGLPCWGWKRECRGGGAWQERIDGIHLVSSIFQVHESAQGLVDNIHTAFAASRPACMTGGQDLRRSLSHWIILSSCTDEIHKSIYVCDSWVQSVLLLSLSCLVQVGQLYVWGFATLSAPPSSTAQAHGPA